MSVEHTKYVMKTACGRELVMKDAKSSTKWIHLHNKVCDKCKGVKTATGSLHTTNISGNKNSIERYNHSTSGFIGDVYALPL